MLLVHVMTDRYDTGGTRKWQSALRCHLLDRDDERMLQAALMQNLSPYRNLEVSDLWCHSGVEPHEGVSPSTHMSSACTAQAC